MRLIEYFILLRIHKLGLCKPFHERGGKFSHHFKGWCPSLQKAYELFGLGDLKE